MLGLLIQRPHFGNLRVMVVENFVAQLRLQDFLVWCILLLSQNIGHPCSFSLACLSSRNCKTLNAHCLQLLCTSEPACAATTQFQSGKLKQKSEGLGAALRRVFLCVTAVQELLFSFPASEYGYVDLLQPSWDHMAQNKGDSG